jgi:SAM-dependent methyltransferase
LKKSVPEGYNRKYKNYFTVYYSLRPFEEDFMTTPHSSESINTLRQEFMTARIVLTGAELDLFSLLADRPMAADEVAAATRSDLRAMTILLDALCALGYLVKQDSSYQTEPSAVPLLTRDSAQTMLPMVQHMGTLWQTWSRLTDIVLGKAAAGRGGPGALHKDHIKAFIGAMHTAAAKMAPAVVAAVNPAGIRNMIDVGGGSGSYTLAFLQASPKIRATLFDLPEVIDMAKERIEAAEMGGRVTLIPGDFYRDPLPSGHDFAFLSAIIHQNSLAQNKALYSKIYQALEPGGRIVVRDHVMSPDRTQPLDGALFAVNMLVGTSEGSTYTFDEIAGGLASAGFTNIRQLQAKGMFSLVEGFRDR